MSRRHTPFGKRSFKFKLKKHTLFSVTLVALLLFSILVVLSFTRQGILLITLNDLLLNFFGWTTIFLPFLLLVTALMFSSRKTALNQPNVILGGGLLVFALAGLSKSGTLGQQLWLNLSTMVTSVGAWLILAGAVLIGFLVLLNTSVDQIIDFLEKGSLLLKNISKGKSKFIPASQMKIRGVSDNPSDKLSPRITSPTATPVSPVKPELSPSLVTNLPTASDQIWRYPPLSLLLDSVGGKADRGDIKGNAAVIEKTLESFGIAARVVEVNLGPAGTQYAIEVALGTKFLQITALEKDLALALAAP